MAARAESAHGATVDALPSARAIRELVAGADPEFIARLSPGDRFFVLEISPELAQRVDATAAAEAYCAAFSLVPADWWGVPGAVQTETSQHLVALGSAAIDCLAAHFDDFDPLLYHHGEANTLAKVLGWSVGDLAAAFAAAILGEPYDHRAPAPERKQRRDELRQQLVRS